VNGWRSEGDAGADNVEGSKSSCAIFVLLSDGACLVETSIARLVVSMLKPTYSGG